MYLLEAYNQPIVHLDRVVGGGGGLVCKETVVLLCQWGVEINVWLHQQS